MIGQCRLKIQPLRNCFQFVFGDIQATPGASHAFLIEFMHDESKINTTHTEMLHHLIKKVFRKTKLKDEALTAGIEEMQQEMGYEKSAIIEKLLIDEIILEFFQMKTMQTLLTGYLTRKGSQAKHVRFADQMVDSAQRRFFRSINALARLRKAEISLQVNIAAEGGQQVNIKK